MTASCHPSDLPSYQAFKDLGAESLYENVPVVKNSDVIIVSVKPQVVPDALGDIKKASEIKADKLFLSIAMGINIKQLEQVLITIRNNRLLIICLFSTFQTNRE